MVKFSYHSQFLVDPLLTSVVPLFFCIITITFLLSLNVSKSQGPWTLLIILAVFNNPVIWIVYSRPLISGSPSPCTNHLVTFPCTPIKIGITVTVMFHNFFSSLARSTDLSLFAFFQFNPVVCWNNKVQYLAGFCCCCLNFQLYLWL